ncbi:hypothetical protein ASPZODRAFT_919782 [Penicilliopsis zonata CBS 506.65]|uniref:Homologous-pairing protein 2 winged helix domain-containing protein n=1 Tax=Penicilliopsis zonata CBS 506.65 TaxID=1073090 RepID=A0A1L9S871_9EURO|nr:hypothetical protein ASPZODRAFT_919782 [Penicilliopsis zonata CBS 506.65]OJJ43352.1 hypothetical protein ASPZODRAFT_919782 [Penicilliopsis zonata CBS 506.65]
MASRKTKPDKSASKGDEGVVLILDYLRAQNRPYSAIEISANLHNKVTKANAAKILKELHGNEEIEGRVSGKQIVYHALQSPEDDASPEGLADLEGEVKRLQEQTTEFKANEKKVRAELVLLCARPTLSELRQDLTRLEREKVTIVKSLEALRSTESVPVSVEERAEVDKEWKKWQRHASARARICQELWRSCSEVLPENMTRAELWESLGLDEM